MTTREMLFLDSHCFVALYFSQKAQSQVLIIAQYSSICMGLKLSGCMHKDVGQCACMRRIIEMCIVPPPYSGYYTRPIRPSIIYY